MPTNLQFGESGQDGEGKGDGVARLDAFGAADLCFERQDVHARAAVGEYRCFPRRFPYPYPHPYRTESPARTRILLAYIFRLFFINIGKVPRTLRSRPEHDFTADFVTLCHASNPPTNR